MLLIINLINKNVRLNVRLNDRIKAVGVVML